MLLSRNYFLTLLVMASFCGTAFGLRATAVKAQGPGPGAGGALAGLTPQELTEFRRGRGAFLRVERNNTGLGPAFNAASCAACHNVPSIGGTSPFLVVRAAYRNEDGTMRGLDAFGETLVHLTSIPPHDCQPVIPSDVAVVAHRASIPMFGAGLVEAIPDEVIQALADPNDVDGDGISGRASIVRDQASGIFRVGRFGWKGQHATLLAFGADAFRGEMGITNDLFPDELAVGVPILNRTLCDGQPDPEDTPDPATGSRRIDDFEAFMRFLAPLPRGPLTGDVVDGEGLFREIGCAECHQPSLVTGPSESAAFDRRAVPLFSDLLLHDVGTGDGIPQAAALPNELRTPALWGLRFRLPLLHDGSASTIEDAIRRHGVEAESVRRTFELLSVADRARLLAFLNSL